MDFWIINGHFKRITFEIYRKGYININGNTDESKLSGEIGQYTRDIQIKKI